MMFPSVFTTDSKMVLISNRVYMEVKLPTVNISEEKRREIIVNQIFNQKSR